MGRGLLERLLVLPGAKGSMQNIGDDHRFEKRNLLSAPANPILHPVPERMTPLGLDVDSEVRFVAHHVAGLELR